MSLTVSFFGIGYVGLTTAACLASKGIKAICFDVDEKKIETVNKGSAPFFEPNLDILVKEYVTRGYLSATASSSTAVLQSDVTFMTVGTPSKGDGSIDLTYVKSAAQMIGKALSQKSKYHTVVVKSTVVPTTTEKVVKPELEASSGLRSTRGFGLCVNPEFLREGNAVEDTLRPDRIVIGELNKKSGDTLELLYKAVYSELPQVIRTTPVNAEMIKYANNAFLATKVSFINQIANLCQITAGADVETVAKAIGMDKRIGPYFLRAGLGWGGSCFPKDLKALSKFADSNGIRLAIIDAAIEVNDHQPLTAIQIAEESLGDLRGKHFSILGLSFKAGSDDLRGAVSIPIIRELLRRKARVFVYDPAAMHNAKLVFGNKVDFSQSVLDCLKDSDCCIIVTEWEDFKQLNSNDFVREMRNPFIIDGRRIYNPRKFSSKLRYAAIGLGGLTGKQLV